MDLGFKTISYDDARNRIRVLDQTRLPGRIAYVVLRTPAEVINAIQGLTVRGAPLIGVTAAYGIVLAARRAGTAAELARTADRILSARPTAVNLSYAVNVMKNEIARGRGRDLQKRLLRAARTLHREDIAACLKIGRCGAPLIKNGAKVMVYCNAGALATSGIGTALGVLYTARRRKKRFTVYACETRPVLQGARLTTWELRRAGIETFCLCDNMAAALMPEMDAVLVGADRIARNGDTANKIGTRGLAIIARHHGVPFYVAAPSSSFDPRAARGEDIPIELRSGREVSFINEIRITAAGTRVRNPAFDITPARLVTAFISDRGLIRPPYGRNIKKTTGR